jgi:transposase
LLQNYFRPPLQASCAQLREVSDDEWELIRPHLPPRAKVGRPRADDRKVLNGILYVLTTGCRWMDMPKRYGHYSTAFRRLKRREGLRVKRGVGRPRRRPEELHAGSARIRTYLRRRGIRANIPSSTRNGRKPSAEGRIGSTGKPIGM